MNADMLKKCSWLNKLYYTDIYLISSYILNTDEMIHYYLFYECMSHKTDDTAYLAICDHKS